MTLRITLLLAACFSRFLLQAQTTLPTSWNFSSPGIATPPAGWTLNLGTNGNLTYAFGIGDAISCRLDATGENFIIHFTDKPGPLSYYLSPQNAGNAWAGQFDIQESNDGNSWNTLRSITSKATTVTNFTNSKYTDNLSASTRYVRFMFVSKLPGGAGGGGNMAIDSVLIQQAPAAPTPKINVKKSGNTVVTGSSLVVGNSSSTPLLIENLGTAQALNIDSIKVSGPAAADFSLSNVPASVAAVSNATFNLNFTPAANGSRLASLAIYSNDPDRPVYTFNLYAIGGTLATEPQQQAASLSVSNPSSYGFKITAIAPAAAPEHYLVLRKQGAGLSEVPQDGISYKRGDYIGSAQVAYVGDTAPVLSPTYIFANSSYTFAAFSYNGPAGYENYLATAPATASVTTSGKMPGTYYSAINPLASDFISKLSQKVNPHDTVFYSYYAPRMISNFITRDTSGGKKVVSCVYTGFHYVYDEPFQWYTGSNGSPLSREHSFAQSLMPSNQGNPDWPNAPGTSNELPEYNDLHHLFPAHQVNANAKRSNNPFGDVKTPSYTSPTGFGKLGTDSFNKTVWEPRPEHKGDLARALFYMCIAYNGINGKTWALPSLQDQAVLKRWHQQDPPDNWEIARHEFIFSQQRNRNPFIDFPEWAERINFSNMTYIPSSSPAAQLSSPAGGEVWTKGNSYAINWYSSNVDSLSIELLLNDTLYSSLAKVPAATGSYTWGIPLGTPDSEKARIRVKNSGANISSASASYFSIRAPLGINTPDAQPELLLFPNPSNGLVHGYLSAPLTGASKLSIRDISGRLLLEQEVGGSDFTIHINYRGICFLELSNGAGSLHRKLIIQ